MPACQEWVCVKLCVCVRVYVCACNIFHLMMLEILLCVTEKEFQLYFSVVFRSWSWWRDRSRKMRYCYILFFALILGCAVCLSLACMCMQPRKDEYQVVLSFLSVCLVLFLSLLSVPVSVCLSHSFTRSEGFWPKKARTVLTLICLCSCVVLHQLECYSSFCW